MNRLIRSEANSTAAGVFRAVPLALILLMSSGGDSALAISSGPPDERTGAPVTGGTEFDCTSCHGTFGLLAENSATQGFSIFAPANYEPGMTYDITVSLTHPDQTRWGFELTAIDASLIGAGMLTAGSDSFSQVTSSGTREYVKQTALGSAAGQEDGQTWTFSWTAPMTDVGSITLYAAGVAANNNGSPDIGDEVFATSIVVPEPAIVLSQLAADCTVACIVLVRRRRHFR